MRTRSPQAARFASTQATTGSEGFAVRMKETIEDFLDPVDGILPARENGIRSSIDDLEEDISYIVTRVEASEISLRAEFTALEMLLGQYQVTSDFLSQQLVGLQNLSKSIYS